MTSNNRPNGTFLFRGKDALAGEKKRGGFSPMRDRRISKKKKRIATPKSTATFNGLQADSRRDAGGGTLTMLVQGKTFRHYSEKEKTILQGRKR